MQNIHLRRTAFAINKGKLSTCTMSNVIEYEYVTSGPLKGGAASFQGGANAPPRPPLKETLHKTAHIQSAISHKVYKFITQNKKQQLLQPFYYLPKLIR